MHETAVMIQALSQAAASLEKVTGSDKQVRELLAKISELTARVRG